MNSLIHLKDTLATRRRNGKHLTGSPHEMLDPEEVRCTSFRNERFQSSFFAISDHSEDVRYAQRWYMIYRAFNDYGMISGRRNILILMAKGEQRLDKLQMVLEELEMQGKHAESQPNWEVDICRWKIKYIEQTLSDGKYFLKRLDEEHLFTSPGKRARSKGGGKWDL
ncbi:hypothetical protein ABW19_dt0210482 [Dactylella cylindrospora]|nr:hypothetical protein ABW19_dt0210482 [Dactylella cylindrospora]